ncbi:hypothetical protein T492DRAFT_1001717 [Pavlovales sp. CCMP2436]|nr:hypothetical protein T492DRAFT_1001717 [Pavlovales sp. CCMP2436]
MQTPSTCPSRWWQRSGRSAETPLAMFQAVEVAAGLLANPANMPANISSRRRGASARLFNWYSGSTAAAA